MAQAFLGIGTNLGDRDLYLTMAQQALAQLPSSRLVAISPVYETDPVSPVPQGRFFNAAAQLQTQLTAHQVLEALTRIEYQAGRPPLSERARWGPRTLDLDLLLYDDQIICDDDLIVPHPHMHERWYVLRPLADLDASLVHPLLEMTIGDLLHNVDPSVAASHDRHTSS